MSAPEPATNWIKFNPDQSGFYMVNYQDSMWDEITKALISNHQVGPNEEFSQLQYVTL